MQVSRWVIGILLLASILRLWALDKVPPELFGDELDVGYHAYSLLATGRDYYGQLLPTYIHSLAEWRAPLLMYVTVPFVGVFGLNEWGVRLPSAVFGVLSIYLLYLLVLKTTRDNLSALASAFFLAISPWHIQYSRAAFEASLLVTLLLAGSLFFFEGLKKSWLLVLSAFFFALTFYTYSTANLFTPLLLFLLIYIYKEQLFSLGKKLLVFSGIVFVVVSLPIAWHILFGYAADRFSNYSVFRSSELTDEIVKNRQEFQGAFEPFFHNKLLSWGERIMSTYAYSFSPKFLFIEGDPVFRHSVHRLGQFYWAQFPFILLGFLWFLARFKDRMSIFWLGWLLLAPIPASLTIDGAMHATRLILMLPPLTVLAGAGVASFGQIKLFFKNSRVVFAVVFFLLFAQFGLYLHRYFIHYPVESWRWWHKGFRETLTYVKSIELDYSRIYFNNTYEPMLVRFLFWYKYDPALFQKQFEDDKHIKEIVVGYNGFRLGEKYYFGEIEKPFERLVHPGHLIVASARDEITGPESVKRDDIELLKTVYSPTGEVLFYILTGRE